MKRSVKSSAVVCLVAGAITPVLVGALAWRFLGEEIREGSLYLWLYRLPMVLPEQFTGSTTLGYLITSLLYATAYFGIIQLARLAIFEHGQKGLYRE